MTYEKKRRELVAKQEREMYILRIRHCQARLALARLNGNSHDTEREKNRLSLLRRELSLCAAL